VQAKQFIDQLAAKQLLSPEIIDELRRQVAESKSRLTPELIARLLVDNGHLTKFQATKLIADIQTEVATKPALNASSSPDSSDLDLLVEDDGAADEATVFIDDDAIDVESVDDDFVAEETVEVVDVQPIEVVEVEPVEVAEVVDAVVDAPIAASAKKSRATKSGTNAVKVKRPEVAKANPWDSFRILGIGLILALVLIAGAWLGYHFWRGSASDMLKRANDAYESRSYETAAAIYKDFTTSFKSDAGLSFAKVRQALALIRKDAENASDPNVGLKTALEVLPGIVGESALSNEQSDLTGILVGLATKFNDRADKVNSIADRKKLMADMEKLLALIDDPQYVGTTQRTQQQPTLQRIREDRERILRGINREEELVKAIATIDTKLAEKDTLGAYVVRREVINRYPQLEADDRLSAKVTEATLIQRELVSPGALNVRLAKEAPPTSLGRDFLLTNSSKGTAPALAGRQVFVKVKGSVYALDGGTGNVLWRRYVGREFQNEPIRLSDTPTSDVLICQPERGQIQRVAGATGATQWFVDTASPTHRPYVDNENVYLSTFDGTVVNLDAVAGQTKWMVKLPQALQVAPGSGPNKQQLYVPAEHSNLYVLSRNDGSCKEVYYLGHRAGAITVPPVLVLGQLFVFENRGDHSLIRILRTNDQGLELKDAQAPFRLKGNIVVPPQVDGRRLFVVSDLGEIAVLDIEPAADKDKVSRFDPVPASKQTPKLSYITAGNNHLWIAEDMFIRMDLVVSRGKLERVWVKDDGDTFTSPPQLIGETIVHCRTLRGNAGVRVSAVNAESGEPQWATDLGVPIVSVITGTGKPDAINSAAMLFTLDPTKLIREKADSNPGEGKSQLLFRYPTALSNNTSLLINASTANQIAVYSPGQATKLRLLSANFGGAKPTCPPVAVEDRFAIGLDNGQLSLFDPSNGAPVADPYQPPMQPGVKMAWNQPAYLADSKTLVAANDSQKLVRLGVGDSLRLLSEVDLENRLVGPLVALDAKVFAVEAAPSADNVVDFNSTSLAKGSSLPLEGRWVSGPFLAEGMVIVQVEEKIQAISAENQQLWAIDFPQSMLLGPPLKSGDNLIFLSISGQIRVVNQASGEVIGSADIGQPLSGAARIISSGIVVGSDEGAVLLVPVPTSRNGE
jgi:outer membrane protein assembly factor BamB